MAKDKTFSRRNIRDYLNKKYNINIKSDGSLRNTMIKNEYEEIIPNKKDISYRYDMIKIRGL